MWRWRFDGAWFAISYFISLSYTSNVTKGEASWRGLRIALGCYSTSSSVFASRFRVVDGHGFSVEMDCEAENLI